MRLLLILSLRVALALTSSALVVRAAGEGETEPAIVAFYNEGMASFQSGDYKKAVDALLQVIERSPADAPIEPVYFTLGSSYFNLPDYEKAISTFKTYQTKYPRGSRTTDAAVAIAQANFSLGKFDEAAELFAALESIPAVRERVLLAQGEAYKRAGKPDKAIATLERLVLPEIKSRLTAQGALTLGSLYGQKGDGARAISILRQIGQKLSLVDNVVRLNSLAVELGDNLFENGKYKEAMACFRVVRERAEIISFQKDRLGALQKHLTQNLAAMQINPGQAAQFLSQNNDLRIALEEGKTLLGELEKLPNFDSSILFRIANCYFLAEKKWEALLVYQKVLDTFPDPAVREPALFGQLLAEAEVGRALQAQAMCETYLKEFPEGPNAFAAGYLSGAVALQAADFAGAETRLNSILSTQPANPRREEMRFLLGNAKFMQGKYEEALAEYLRYQKDFSKGPNAEEAAYRVGMAHLFGGRIEEALMQMNTYLQAYPKGQFVSDAKYRVVVCEYAAQSYEDVISSCVAWEKQYSDDPQLGEVLALRGDAQAALNRLDDAVASYTRSSKAAATDEVLNYALFEAAKISQKQGKWDQISKMFEEFVKEKPEHPSVVSAVYWIGRARVREGKVEEAKQFIATTVERFIEEPKRDAVEQLLSQLAQLCGTKNKIRGPTAASGSSVANAAPLPEPSAELGRFLERVVSGKNATAQARVLFAKAELARFRKEPGEQEKILREIAAQFQPVDLSPVILGAVGDVLLAGKEHEKAALLYQQLADEHPKSAVVDSAYVGLGEMALANHDHERALKLFTHATDKFPGPKIKEATLGRGKALLALQKFDEAKKIFEQVASIKEWRGDATAFSVYSLGEIEAQQGRWPEANAYFQRVYVAYQRYLPWVAKAYIRSAEVFEKMGRRQEAVNTYKELLRNEKLADFAEAQQARKRLQDLGQG